MHLSPLDTHVGLLIRTWTRYSEPGQPRPHAEQGVYVRDSGFTRGTGGTAVHQTHYITRGPAIPNPGHLIRTRTRYSKPGLPHPHVNPLFRTRASSPTCGTEGLPAEQGAQPYTRPTTSHANPLFRTWAISSAREPAIPSLGDPAHMQNSGLTCGTEGLRAGQGAQPYTRPTTSHANPLFRTWAISSAREPAIPSLGDPAHMRNSGLTCGTGGLRAGRVGVQVVVARG